MTYGRPQGLLVRQSRVAGVLKQELQRRRFDVAGKKPLVAITACMRKLIILMNHLLKKPNFSLAP